MTIKLDLWGNTVRGLRVWVVALVDDMDLLVIDHCGFLERVDKHQVVLDRPKDRFDRPEDAS